MGLDDVTKKKLEQTIAGFYEARIPAQVRSKIGLHIEFRGNAATLIEDRPRFDKPEEWTHSPVAQFRFDEGKKTWTLYCCDRNSKWYVYEPAKPAKSFDALLDEVDRDPTGIFWG